MNSKSYNENSSFPTLSVLNLTSSLYIKGKWKPIIQNINFEIKPGETLAVVGESGSGKSVTALSIMRLLEERTSKITGKILLDGQDILSLPLKKMHKIRGNKIGMIFQEPMSSLNPVLTIGEQISEVLIYHKGISKAQAKKETIELLEKVYIPNAKRRFHEYPHQFSGGMCQRVMIVMSLAMHPKLLIADEPTTSLDVTIQNQIINLLKTLQEEYNISILFITHDMGIVAEVADHIAVMYEGNIVENAPTSKSHHYKQALLSTTPRLGSMKNKIWPQKFPTVDITTDTIKEGVSIKNTIKNKDDPIISVKNLTTYFDVQSGFFRRKIGSIYAVQNVSFDLYQGETLSIVGESGSGKSTTGRSIIRLIEPNSGSVIINGCNILTLDRSSLRTIRRSIQMVFQNPLASLNPSMSIGASIIEPFLEHKLGTKIEAIDKAAEILTRVGLKKDMMKRFPHQFSGGQRQRICIARCLILDPKVIIADESVSALDSSIKVQVCNLLMELQESLGISYIFITHDMSVTEKISHRVAVMRLGEIVEIGSRAQIFQNPQHPYTNKLLMSIPTFDLSQRNIKKNLLADEIANPIRPINYQPPERQHKEVEPGHIVQLDHATVS
ncbi:Oligopeptide transport ATP-binding protein OppD [Liberibacter crescens BT-1]|uniref:Glutathione import ATP-binding protein GsiA n=1 Tax=Liberibacter crescens (strain BT-1) TaxID=1215343 RepID=L0ETM8_LIBCB|nr:ABC transporter ATP-binding protein [Liberibacter crescens]AGA64317.1 Oligopeptide transport ATP-binding protein OppD [Liberibacter crescens BT-1]AMC12530.1 glutathione ABC transporter ATP-binding protein [Liberibacter crescens]